MRNLVRLGCGELGLASGSSFAVSMAEGVEGGVGGVGVVSLLVLS